MCYRKILTDQNSGFKKAAAEPTEKPIVLRDPIQFLKRTKQLLASHWLVLLNPCQQIRLSALFHSFLPFACANLRGHSAAWKALPSA
jgi:hypothetical protein